MFKNNFDKNINALCKYEFCIRKIPESFVIFDGVKIGKFLIKLKNRFTDKNLTQKQVEKSYESKTICYWLAMKEINFIHEDMINFLICYEHNPNFYLRNVNLGAISNHLEIAINNNTLYPFAKSVLKKTKFYLMVKDRVINQL